MEAVLILAILVFGTPILISVISLAKVKALERKVEELQDKVYYFKQEWQATTRRTPSPASVPPQPSAKTEPATPPYTTEPRPAPPVAPRTERPPLPANSTPTVISPPRQQPAQEQPKPVSQPLPSELLNRKTPPSPEPAPSAPVAPHPSVIITPKQHSRTREEWEMLIGGKLFNYLAAIALIITVGLFLKVAIDRNWISLPIRLLISYSVSFSLLVLGRRFHRQGLPGFAQGLIGAGIAVCYLSGYAAYVPALIGAKEATAIVPFPVAFVLMTGAAVLAFQQALLYDSLPIALLGWLGAFLTPFLLHHHQSSPLGLYTYLVMVNAGMVAIGIKRDKWVVLEPITLCATYLIYISLFIVPGAPEPQHYPLLSAIFLTLIWAISHSADISRGLQRVESFSELRWLLAILNSAVNYSFMNLTLNRDHHDVMGLVTLGIACAYFGSAMLCEVRQCTVNIAIPRITVTAIVLLALATLVQFTGFTVVTLWALEALMLIWCGLYCKRRYIWITALTLCGVAFCKLMFVENAFAWEPIREFVPCFNPRVLAYGTLVATLAAAALLFRRYQEEAEEIRTTLTYAWCTLLFALLTIEVNDAIRLAMATQTSAPGTGWTASLRFMTIAFCWVLYSMPLVGFGLRGRRLPILICGLLSSAFGMLLVGIAAVGWEANPNLQQLIVTRGIILGLVMVSLALQAQWVENADTYPWLPGLRQFLHARFAIIGFELITLEVIDAAKWLSGACPSLNQYIGVNYLSMLILGLGWALYALTLLRYGVRKQSPALLISGISAMLLGVVWLAFSGAVYTPTAAFLPVFNIRAAAFLIGIAATVVMGRILRGQEERFTWLTGIPSLVQFVNAVLLFELVTVEVLDTFTHLATLTPAVNLHISPDLARILTLTICWMLYAVGAVIYSLRTKMPVILHLGLLAAVLAVVVLGLGGSAFLPLSDFTLLFNYRAVAFLLVIASTLVLGRLLKAHEREYDWIAKVPAWVQFFAATLIFELITAEIYDFFGHLAIDPRMHLPISMELARIFTLIIGWALFALPLVWYSFRKQAPVLFYCGICAAALAIVVACANGISYLPVENFTLLFNYRALMFLMVIIAVLILEQLVKGQEQEYPWLRSLPVILQIVTSIMLFEVITAEIWDHFARLLSKAVVDDSPTYNLLSFRQAAISIAWLVYGILLMGYGFVRRITALRLVAIILFALAVVKIFFYDLASLEMLYRVFSFLGLALILFAASYLYQRYKHLLFPTSKINEPGESAPPSYPGMAPEQH